jgi:hypothetical protein
LKRYKKRARVDSVVGNLVDKPTSVERERKMDNVEITEKPNTPKKAHHA